MTHHESGSQRDVSLGIVSGIAAYTIWGFLPMYWKLLDHVPSGEVLAHRIIWSLVLMLIVLFSLRKSTSLLDDLRYIRTYPKILAGLFLASLFISINWFSFIWAVTNDRVIEASLGYYINPLVSVLLGVLFLKEKVSYWQKVSFIIALIGVLSLTLSFGTVPVVGLILAFSFAFYGLVKKLTQIGAFTGLTIETFILTPVAIVFLFITHSNMTSLFYFESDFSTFPLLIGAGAVTAVPLLLFGIGARKIPLSMIGFLQYIAPTIMLFLGVFSYGELFSLIHFISFSLIWLALVIYSFSKTSWLRKLEPQKRKTPVGTDDSSSS
ncbi:EamA family transporter RarD [Alteribacter populi]|uniref:EamA family transporter RarD n=1 Tax=Alteribacter populi TaxID=2011011 RepID=UPI000BBB2557|nr:EamA family transporter RarD [Alteribacter populi]